MSLKLIKLKCVFFIIIKSKHFMYQRLLNMWGKSLGHCMKRQPIPLGAPPNKCRIDFSIQFKMKTQ